MTSDLKEHWNTAYNKEDEQLGWFEANPMQTMELVKACNLQKDATILNVGAGTTTLIDTLLEEGYTNIIANDLSDLALEKLKQRIRKSHNYNLTCIKDDLTNPQKINKLQNIDLWIDRAVLHFFLTQEEQKSYFSLIQKTVSNNGYVIIAVFSLEGAQKCCGLDLKRYNLEMLQNNLGTHFRLIKTFNHTFINPFGGERPYIYTLFQRQS
jgi:cyclopropane fatty-acyl-phospholipid synthase-like methyltransferase